MEFRVCSAFIWSADSARTLENSFLLWGTKLSTIGLDEFYHSLAYDLI